MDEELKNKVRSTLEKCWSYETSVCYNPDIAPISYGQCAPTAITVQELLGGDILKTYINKLNGGQVRHFYNRIDGEIIDFTSDQFDIPEYWCEPTYDNALSSIDEALTEMLPGQIEAMRAAFKKEWRQ